LKLDEQSHTVSLSGPNQGKALTTADSGVVVWDGKANRLVQMKLEGSVEGGNSEARFKTAGEGLRAEHHLYEKDGVVRWDVTIENQRKEQAWLEVRYAGQLSAPRPWMFYNAAQSYEPAETEYTGETTFWPGVAVAGPKGGFWVGVDPHQIYSLITYQFEGAEGKAAGSFYSGARIVLDPGQKLTMGFTLLGFEMAYGHRSALEAYYDAFPDCFNPASNIDPRILRGGDDGNVAWRSAKTQGQDSACEIPRRTASTWDWMYCPYPIPGDPAMRKDQWELTKPEHRNEHAHSWNEIESFRRYRQNYFYATDITYDIAPMFYVIPWVHEDLARTIFKDSLMTEDMGWENNKGSHKGWIAKKGYVKVGPFDSVEVLGWGTSAGDAFKRDYKDLVDGKLTFSGFAFDSNVSAGKYRGPRLKDLPGRAWDAQGVYVSEGVAQALMADYLHGLKKNGYRVGVVANQPGTHYAMAFRTDASILEIGWGSIVLPSGQIIPREYARAQAGHKPRNLHKGFSGIANILPNFKGWEKMSPEQIRQTVEKVQDRMVIFGLAYGWNLTPDSIMGDARLLKYAPVIAEAANLGWQPVPAIRLQSDGENIFLSRYGDRTNAILCIGNNRESRVQTDVTIDPAPFGGRRVLLTDYWGGAVGVVNDQYGERLGADLAPRGMLVLRSAVLLKTDAAFSGSARREGDEQAGKIIAELSLSKAARGVAAEVVLPRDVKVGDVTLNGRAVKWNQGDSPNVISIQIDLNAGKNVLEAGYSSTQILCPVADLKQFPFVDAKGGKGLCQIVIADEAKPREKGAAFRIGEYFRFWSAMTGKEVQLPIVTEAKAGDLPRIYIGDTKAHEPAGVVRKDGNLFIRGDDPRQTNRLLDRVLAILDETHPVVGKFQNQVPYPNRPMVGNYYTSRWSRSSPWIPKEGTGKLIETIFKKGDIWGRPLRETTLPASVTAGSRVVPPGAAGAAAGQTPGHTSAQKTVYLFNADQDDLYFDKQPFRLANDAGEMTYGGFAGATVFRIQSKPKNKTASLMIPLPRPDALAGMKTLHLRFRLAEPAAVPSGHFTLTSRIAGDWQKRLAPSDAPRELKAGQWYDLSYDISSWDLKAVQYLRLYHAPADRAVTYDLAAVWGE
jgi:hypothetical protein